MKPTERLMARHALGLPNERKRSYRNRYVTGGKDGEAAWDSLVERGLAEKGTKRQRSGAIGFCLTYAGACLALDTGETLDPEDFAEVRR